MTSQTTAVSSAETPSSVQAIPTVRQRLALSQPPVPEPGNQLVRLGLLQSFGWLLAAWLAFPWAAYTLFRSRAPRWQKLTISGLGFPLFLVTYALLGIIGFGSLLPALDVRVGNRPDRTIINSGDHYAVTFLKTSRETGRAYELVQVELGPHGGNDWHYHANFVETFTAQQGQLSIGLEGRELTLLPGQRTQAAIRQMHKFYNQTDKPTRFLVQITPGRGFEKTLRCAYGLINTGMSDKDSMPKSLWHLCLLLGYSESYMPGLPGFIQEPLVQSLAKIAQWKGEDKALEQFYKNKTRSLRRNYLL